MHIAIICTESTNACEVGNATSKQQFQERASGCEWTEQQAHWRPLFATNLSPPSNWNGLSPVLELSQSDLREIIVQERSLFLLEVVSVKAPRHWYFCPKSILVQTLILVL